MIGGAVGGGRHDQRGGVVFEAQRPRAGVARGVGARPRHGRTRRIRAAVGLRCVAGDATARRVVAGERHRERRRVPAVVIRDPVSGRRDRRRGRVVLEAQRAGTRVARGVHARPRHRRARRVRRAVRRRRVTGDASAQIVDARERHRKRRVVPTSVIGSAVRRRRHRRRRGVVGEAEVREAHVPRRIRARSGDQACVRTRPSVRLVGLTRDPATRRVGPGERDAEGIVEPAVVIGGTARGSGDGRRSRVVLEAQRARAAVAGGVGARPRQRRGRRVRAAVGLRRLTDDAAARRIRAHERDRERRVVPAVVIRAAIGGSRHDRGRRVVREWPEAQGCVARGVGARPRQRREARVGAGVRLRGVASDLADRAVGARERDRERVGVPAVAIGPTISVRRDRRRD